jgi:glycosyltransferase involved in cell wall biosynthesis
MGTDCPVVSVVMPMRNAEEYVAAALTSVLRECTVSLEVVVVEDGSTDRSLEQVKSIQDPRVRVVEGPQRGFSASMNAGINAARGKIVMQCDADDLYPLMRISEQVDWLDSNPQFEAVCGAFSTIDVRGKLIAPMNSQAEAADITDELRGGRVRTSFCTFAVRAPLLKNSGGFREYFVTGGDIDLQLRLSEAGRIGFVPRCWYQYRIHDASITRQQPTRERQFFERIAYEFQTERKTRGTDALDRGAPPDIPTYGSSALHGANAHVQGLLLGRAWREHRMGKKGKAVRTGTRAVMTRPLQFEAWRSLAALLWKRPDVA